MIELSNLSKRVGAFSLTGVNLKVRRGEYLVVLGPTGSGKTLLLDLIIGRLNPDGGRILLAGKDVTHTPPEERNIGIVYQECLLFPHLSVSENIRFGLKSQKLPGDETNRRFDGIVDLLNIRHLAGRNPQTLSGGEKQRVALARALVIRPEVLLLDETLASLDPNTRRELADELKLIHRRLETTTIHVTHNFEEALTLADRIAVMQQGGIVQIGPPGDIFRTPQSEFVATFTGAENLFEGLSNVKEGLAEISVRNGAPEHAIRICSATQKEGKVWVAFRPEDVLISREQIKTSARNCYRGKIRSISDNGIVTKVMVDVGIPIKSLVTRRSFQDLSLEINSDVYISFKATEVHVF
ncbi:MAG: ABC transporter ATP-binding protein [bacterium]|nr:ABC transporter ATP-binding protein [bacterium]